MPVDVLLVEGNLDLELLGAVFRGRPTVERGGEKRGLVHEVRRRRKKNGPRVCYLRDRDFDFAPVADLSQPTVDRREGAQVLGWRWCRHEIENYLLEPRLVALATGWEQSEFETALLNAANQLRDYQIARWVIGNARTALPPHFELETRPVDLGEFILPPDLSQTFCFAWAKQSILVHFNRIQESLSQPAVHASITTHSKILEKPSLTEPSPILVWWSGKDLFAALTVWLIGKGRKNAGDFRAELRDWFINNTEQGIELLPEWQMFQTILTT